MGGCVGVHTYMYSCVWGWVGVSVRVFSVWVAVSHKCV